MPKRKRNFPISKKRLGRPPRIQKIVFKGVGDGFVANRIQMGPGPRRKVFLSPRFTHSLKPQLVIEAVDGIALGRLGRAYDLVAFRGKQRINLVVKKYSDKKNQNKIAEKEFKLFKKLKQKGYSVPPRVMLVEIKGKKYLALTDLSKFGDLIIESEIYAEKFVGKKRMEKVLKQVQKETERAKKSDKLDISDSWRYVINTKKKTVKAFILSSRSISES